MVPEKVPPPGLNYATVEKRREKGRVVEILTRVVFGTMAAVLAALAQSKVSRWINTSFLERQNATDRHRNARKVRKTYTFSKDWRVHESMTYSPSPLPGLGAYPTKPGSPRMGARRPDAMILAVPQPVQVIPPAARDGSVMEYE